MKNGTGYYPEVYNKNDNPPRYIPWDAEAIEAHISGRRTYGHYLLDTDSSCKLFAFDIDLDQTGRLPTMRLPMPAGPGNQETEDYYADAWYRSFTDCNPREAWLDRAHPARPYIKAAMRTIAHIIQREIDKIGMPSAVAYTGAKGIHVYGFTGRMDATTVRAGCKIVLDSLPVKPVRGELFYKWADPSKYEELQLFTIEVFPKQDKIQDGGFGNLMRLPLGVNLKSQDPTFFVDTSRPFGELTETDPLALLTKINLEM
jgi:hypothetical protein